MLELHGSADPATLKLLICLEELGLEYTLHELDLPTLANWAPPHRSLAPQGEFPVLISDGSVMTDATIALLYLAESNPIPKLLPSNLVDRYSVQALDDVLDGAFLGSVNLLGWHKQTSAEVRSAFYEALRKVPGRRALAGWSEVWTDAESDRLRRAEEKIAAGFVKAEQTLGERQWLVGPNYTVADVNAFALIEGLSLAMPGVIGAQNRPGLSAWLERMRRRPAVKTALAQTCRPDGLTVFAPPQ
jgi:GSH-dependent disulfide-bond oxidoreductase